MTTYSGVSLIGVDQDVVLGCYAYNSIEISAGALQEELFNAEVVNSVFNYFPLVVRSAEIDLGMAAEDGDGETGTFISVITLPGGITVRTHV